MYIYMHAKHSACVRLGPDLSTARESPIVTSWPFCLSRVVGAETQDTKDVKDVSPRCQSKINWVS